MFLTSPEPECASLVFLERSNPTRAARRADFAALAFLAPIPKKLVADIAGDEV